MRRINPLRLSLEPGFRLVVSHPILTIIAVTLITAVFAGFIPQLGVEVDFTSYLNQDDPAVAAAERAKDRYGSQLMMMVVVDTDDGIFNPATLELIEGMGDKFDRLSIVSDVIGPLNFQIIRGSADTIRVGPAAPGGKVPTSPEGIAAYRGIIMDDRRARGFVVSADGKAAAFYLRANRGVDMIPFAEAVETVADEFKGDGARIFVTGIPYINLSLGRSMRRDLKIFLPLVILLIVAVLYAGFRWRWGVVIPLAVVGMTVVVALGLMSIFGVPITVVSFILPVILMAIGIADGIHVLNRYNEEIAAGTPKREAILATMTAMQGPVVMTSLTTAAGFLSLLNSYFVPQRTFGLFTSVGILVAMLLSLFLIPSILSLVPVPKPATGRKRRGGLTVILTGMEKGIIRHGRIVLVVGIVVGVVFGAGFSRIRIETTQRAYIGEGHPAVAGLDILEERFSGGEQAIIEIDTSRRDGLKDPALLREIIALQDHLEEEGVARTESIADIVREMNQRFHADDPAYYTIPDDPRFVAQLLLLFTFQGGDLDGLALADFSAGEVLAFHGIKQSSTQASFVNDLTAYLNEHFSSYGRAEMVGATRIQVRMLASIAKSQIRSLLTSIGAAGLIVILLMGSIIYGLISLVPLLFTIAINFGIMAYSGTPLDIATLMVSSITIGIGIDYGIHYISRFREGLDAGRSVDEAVVASAGSAGRAIVYNALSLALGFSVLLLSVFHGMRSFGTLISATMLISAISALTVIPALLGVLGKTRILKKGR